MDIFKRVQVAQNGSDIISFLFLQELKLAVCGSQIVGLVPLGAMLSAADYFIEKENLFILNEDQKIRLVSPEA